MIVFHHNDLDGRCAAAIVRAWRLEQRNVQGFDGDIQFIEMDYKDRVPMERVSRNDMVVIVDFSFKPDDMEQVISATDQKVIWCDHHVTAKDYGYEVPGKRDFSDKGLAGCEVTWEYFFPQEMLPPMAVKLIGDYDSWRFKHAPTSLAFYEGLKLEQTDPASQLWTRLFRGEGVDKIVAAGRVAIRYRDNYCASMRKTFGYETKIDGVRAYAANIYQFGSQGFGTEFFDFPVCIAYAHDGQKFTVSLYSKTVDVGVIAKKHGGGGHKGAAGFVCETLPFGPTR